MNTSSLLRRIGFVILFWLSGIGTSGAVDEWITLQVPLSRSGHSFSLWEKVLDGTPGAVHFAGGDFSGLEVGDYKLSLATPVAFAGGHVDEQGNWHPDAGSYLTVEALRTDTDSFWLRDDTTGQFAPRDQFGLTTAVWRDPNPSVPMRLFALPESRAGHVLMLQYAGGASFVMSQSAVQGEYSGDGTSFYSYGFFEAWAPLMATGEPDLSRIIDFTGQEGVRDFALAASDLLNPDSWVFPLDVETPTHQVTFVVRDDSLSAPESFTLHIDEGGAQSGMSTADASFGMIFSGSVGQGRSFWLVRSDGASTPYFQMSDTDQTLDVRAVFADPPPPNLQTVYFRIRDSHSVWSMSVRYADTNEVAIGVGGGNSIYSWDQQGNTTAMNYYDCWATVDANQSWSVYENGADLGPGPDFFDGWTPGNLVAPAGGVGFYVAAQRHSHTLKVAQQGTWALTNSESTFTIATNDPLTGDLVQWEVFWATGAIDAPGQPCTVIDESWGDQDTVDSSNSTALVSWFPRSPLMLKISSTRWQHDLRVRTETGAEFPVTQHNVQGDWSLDGNGRAWFNSYDFLDASSTMHAGMVWSLVDLTQLDANGDPTVLTADASDPLNFINALDNTDTDMDGLADWYERMIGTDLNNWDTDGDLVSDGDEIAVGTNPRARAATMAGSTLKVFTPLQ